MKKTRKLIPALAMLLISAVMMSTASFAWFSMNEEVTATGMNITAESDNVWLAINGGTSFDPTGTKTEYENSALVNLYPVAPAVALTATNVKEATSWHFAYSKDVDSAAKDPDRDYKVVAAEDFGKYVASEKFYIGLSNISAVDSVEDLKLKSVTLPADTGISVVVVCGDKIVHLTDSSASVNEVIADTVDDSGVEVTVYYYINGENDNVKTSNIANLHGQVELLFGIN